MRKLIYTAVMVAIAATASAADAKETVWVERSKDAVKAKMKDPNSAQFRNVYFSRSGGVPVACGEVNAKNSYGGYRGYQFFIAAGDSLTVLESEVSDFKALWQQLCK